MPGGATRRSGEKRLSLAMRLILTGEGVCAVGVSPDPDPEPQADASATRVSVRTATAMRKRLSTLHSMESRGCSVDRWAGQFTVVEPEADSVLLLASASAKPCTGSGTAETVRPNWCGPGNVQVTVQDRPMNTLDPRGRTLSLITSGDGGLTVQSAGRVRLNEMSARTLAAGPWLRTVALPEIRKPTPGVADAGGEKPTAITAMSVVGVVVGEGDGDGSGVGVGSGDGGGVGAAVGAAVGEGSGAGVGGSVGGGVGAGVAVGRGGRVGAGRWLSSQFLWGRWPALCAEWPFAWAAPLAAWRSGHPPRCACAGALPAAASPATVTTRTMRRAEVTRVLMCAPPLSMNERHGRGCEVTEFSPFGQTGAVNESVLTG